MPRGSSATVKVFYPTWTHDELVELLRRRMPVLQRALPVTRVVLFGSYATGRHTVASDVDLLVVYADPPRDDAFRLVRQHLHIRRLEPHLYTDTEYAAVKPTVDRMVRDGVELLEWEERDGVPTERDKS